ncbi:MAG: hypothetical protein ACXWP5_06300 [Bdellovibrionota bacterium]
MKKLTTVWTLITLLAVSALSVGCSHAKKADEQASAPSADVSKSAQASPVDLGASSAGRGR